MIATPKMPVTASRRPQLDDLPTRALSKVLEDLALGVCGGWSVTCANAIAALKEKP